MLHFLHSESKGLLYAVPISLCVCQSDTGFELGEGRAVHRVLTYVLCSVSPRINSWAHKASPPSDWPLSSLCVLTESDCLGINLMIALKVCSFVVVPACTIHHFPLLSFDVVSALHLCISLSHLLLIIYVSPPQNRADCSHDNVSAFTPLCATMQLCTLCPSAYIIATSTHWALSTIYT